MTPAPYPAQALRELIAATRRRVPCLEAAHDPDDWTSDRRDERDRAAQLCAGCPVIEACRLAGASEVFGVWGGIDVGDLP